MFLFVIFVQTKKQMIMYRRLFFFVLLCAVLLSPGSLYAQRMIPGQWHFSFGGQGWYHIPLGDCRNPTLYGGELSMSRVNYGNKLVVRVGGNTSLLDGYYIADNENAGWSSTTVNLRFIDLYASYGYLWNIAHSRSHGVNLWGGASVDAGARLRRPVPKPVLPVYGYPAVSFMPGFSPELNFEVFMGSRASFSLFLRAHMQWPVVLKKYAGNTKEPWFLPMFGVQFNFYQFIDR